MAKDAIRGVINSVAGTNGAEIAKRLLTARHELMHGRGGASMEAKCKMPLAQLVNELAVITHAAIQAVIVGERDISALLFGHVEGEFQNLIGIARAPLFFDHKADTDQPAEKDIPKATVSVHHRFGEAKA